jgi:predicted  nucleic acid-binding Zn-ribbon protein
LLSEELAATRNRLEQEAAAERAALAAEQAAAEAARAAAEQRAQQLEEQAEALAAAQAELTARIDTFHQQVGDTVAALASAAVVDMAGASGS